MNSLKKYFIFAIVMFFCLPAIAFAGSESSSESILKKYLDAVMIKDVDTIVDLISYEKQGTDQLEKFLNEGIDNEVDLIDYRILKKDNDSFLVELVYVDGLITHVELNVINDRVIISNETLQIPQNDIYGLEVTTMQLMNLYPPQLASFNVTNQAAGTKRNTNNYSGLTEFGILVNSVSTHSNNNVPYVTIQIKRSVPFLPDTLLNQSHARGPVYTSVSGISSNNTVYADFLFPENNGNYSYSISGTIRGE